MSSSDRGGSSQLRDPVWERQLREDPRRFEWFEFYRDIGEGRSRPPVAAHFNISENTVRYTANRWRWAERAASFDTHLRLTRKYAMEEEERKTVREWAGRREVARGEEWRLAVALRAKAYAMLEFPLLENKTTVTYERDGAVVNETTVIKPNGWNLNTTAQLIRLSAELARHSTGMDAPQQSEESIRERLRQMAEENGLPFETVLNFAAQAARSLE